MIRTKIFRSAEFLDEPGFTVQHDVSFVSLVPEYARPGFKVLDVASGTGLVGDALHPLGFRSVDAVGQDQLANLRLLRVSHLEVLS